MDIILLSANSDPTVCMSQQKSRFIRPWGYSRQSISQQPLCHGPNHWDHMLPIQMFDVNTNWSSRLYTPTVYLHDLCIDSPMNVVSQQKVNKINEILQCEQAFNCWNIKHAWSPPSYQPPMWKIHTVTSYSFMIHPDHRHRAFSAMFIYMVDFKTTDLMMQWYDAWRGRVLAVIT